MLLVILRVKKLLERFTKNNCKKKKEKEKEKAKRVKSWKSYQEKKWLTVMLNSKATIILLTVGLIKNI